MDTHPSWHMNASPDALGPGAKRALLGTMLGAHLLAGWALLQVPAVREAASEVAPMVVDLVAPTPEAPPPPQPRVQPKTPPLPAPVIAARPPPLPPPPSVVTATPPLPEPPPMHPPEAPPALPAPPAPVAPPVPPTPAPALAPATPRQVVLTDSDWVRVPEIEYPLSSRRLKEEGTVTVRALIDARGVPKQVVLQRSSGHARLDQQALRAAMTARVRPRTENGVPFEFWIAMPLAFELED
ncbi:energy transducer TonB [Sphaerotilus sp.]|uniref:energy transducer TonB n=1 Tax=Sphaerotilus sp. TaxID=2093942 RepID=UPI0034E1CDBE